MTAAAYLYRDGQLERLTHDHTWVQSLVDEGKISESEAALHPHRSLLLKVLNGQPTNDPDLTMVPVKAGDRLDVMQRRRLRTDRRRHDRGRTPASLTSMTPSSVSSSNLSHEGGIDNITVIVADVVEAGGNDEVIVLGAASEQPIRATGCAAPAARRGRRRPRRHPRHQARRQ